MKKQISSVFSRAFQILSLKNPVRTGLGVFLGGSIQGICKFLAPVIEKNRSFSLEGINLFHFICIGLCIVHLPFFVISVIRKPAFSEDVDDILQLMDLGNLSDDEKKEVFNTLINDALKSVSTLTTSMKTLENTQERMIKSVATGEEPKTEKIQADQHPEKLEEKY